MTMVKMIITSCLLSLLLLPQAVAAANLKNAFTLNTQIGGYVFEGNRDGELDNTMNTIISVGYNFDKNLGAELGYSHAKTHDVDDHTNNIDTGVIDLLYHFMPDKEFVPVAIAGVGLSHNKHTADDDIIVEYGLGFKYFLSDNFALRAEAKHVFDINADDDGSNVHFHNNFSYSAGFTVQNNKW